MIDIRSATHTDIETINSLASIIFPATYKDIISQEQIAFMFEMMYAPHNIEKQMAEGHLYYIAELDGEPCGYISIRELGAAHYYIEKIYALPSLHGKGVGKALFDHACTLALELCGEKECLLELNVNRYNHRAVSFYTKMGMHADRQTDNHVGSGYYANDYVMAIKLKRD